MVRHEWTDARSDRYAATPEKGIERQFSSNEHGPGPWWDEFQDLDDGQGDAIAAAAAEILRLAVENERLREEMGWHRAEVSGRQMSRGGQADPVLAERARIRRELLEAIGNAAVIWEGCRSAIETDDLEEILERVLPRPE